MTALARSGRLRRPRLRVARRMEAWLRPEDLALDLEINLRTVYQ